MTTCSGVDKSCILVAVNDNECFTFPLVFPRSSSICKY
jgi:hypothetical protein